MRVLVTGANGFVGAHLCKGLLESGHVVRAAVRSRGSAPEGTDEYIVADIGPDTDWVGALESQDAVIHLAARVHVMTETAADPGAAFDRVNTVGTATLARAAAAAGIRRFVFLSSIKVNGESTPGRPFTVLDPANPQDAYGVSKMDAEKALRALEAAGVLDLVIIRSPLVYGPGVGGNMLRSMKMLRLGVPLPLASVRNRRTLISVWNLADILVKAATDPAAAGALVLAGDRVSPSTPELLTQLGRAMGKPAKLLPFPLGMLRFFGLLSRQSPVVVRLIGSLEVVPGSSNAFAWEERVPFSEGIRRTGEWFAKSDGATKSK